MKHFALMALLVLPSVYAQKAVVQPSDIANLKGVEAPHISPDGKLIVYTVHTPVAADKHAEDHIWLVPADHSAAAKPFAFSGASEHAPDFAPDGTHIAFLSDRPNPLADPATSPYHFSVAPGTQAKDVAPDLKWTKELAEAAAKGQQLWWISLAGGEAEPLTNLPGNIRNFKWSPDGRFIAFIRTDSDTPEQRARKADKNDQTFIDREYHFDRLWIYDVAQRQARLLTTGDMNIDTLDWSPDGKSIVSRVSPTPRLDDYWRVSKVLIFNVASGALSSTVEEHSGYEPPSFSKDGLRLAFSRFTPLGITDVHIVRNLADGKEIKLEDKLPGTVSRMLWAGTESRLLVTEYLGAHREELDVDAASFSVKPLAGTPETAEDFEASHDGSVLTFLGEDPSTPPEVFAWQRGKSKSLTSTNPQVAGWSLGTQREISWKNTTDKKTVFGVLVLPPGYQAGQKYKTIVHVHGGPEEAWVVGFNGNWYNYATMLASHGYVVLLANPRGSDGQGPAFTEANYQDWGGGDFADIMAGVDYLIAQGITDPDRVAIGGWSYGGFMTSWAVTHTDRFKAGMVGAAVTDLYSMSTTTDIAPSFLQGYMGPLAGNFAVYDKHSPVRYLSQCHTPVLVLHGEADPRVPLFQGQEFYHGLRFLNKDAVMVTYPREPHIFTEREHQIDSLSRIVDWYDSHLGK